MANKHTGIMNPASAPVRGGGRTTGESARERLLAGLPVTHRRLSLNGVLTAVLEGGGGPPIVLLHGPGAYGAHWLRVIPSLVTTHRVIAPDLPGHGESEMFEGSLATDLVSGWLDDLIECTCSIPPIVVGQALGGAIAARFASERGDRLAALVLVDALGLSAFQPTPEFGSALNEFLSAPTERTHDLLWSRCAFDLTSLRRRMGEQWESLKAYNLDRARTPGRLAALGGLMERFGVPAIPPETLARIAVPTTLIWGRHDLAIPLPIAEKASARFGWGLHVIDDAADDPPMEQSEAFVNVLRAVLGTSLEKERAKR
jgi:pimeloyl-ACP methyl ester carboxylesterase